MKSRLAPLLLAYPVHTISCCLILFGSAASAKAAPRIWCVLVEDDSNSWGNGPEGREKEAEGEDEIAPKIPTKRPPLAEEVGPPAGSQERTTPLPGLPVDSSFDSVNWIAEGPVLTKNGDLNIAPLHPTAGCVTAVVPHPTDQNIVYIGTSNGGVWKTTNALTANVRWKPLTDNELSLSIGGLAMDPNDATGNTLVAGFGRRSSYSGSGGAHKGLLRTTNGGGTWTRLGELPTQLAGRNIYQISVRGNTMLMAVPSADPGSLPGLYRTTDGGTIFTNMSGASGSGLPAGAVTHLAGDPSNSTRFYLHVASNGVYRSIDSGATWTSISAGMAAASVGQLALTVSNNGTLFAAELTGTSRVYRSTNQGGAWTQMDSVQANTSSTFNGFVADPGSASVVYLSGLYTRCCFPYSGRVVRGDAALPINTQWTSIASTQLQPGSPQCGPTCPATAAGGTAPHTDSRAMAFTAGARLIECDDGGIYELNIANVGSEGDGTNGGGTWRSLNGNLQITEMHSMAYDALSRIFIGGAQDTAFQEQLEPGLSQAGKAGWQNTSNGDGGEAAVDLLTTPGKSIRYGSSQNLGGFFRTVYDANNVQQSRSFPAHTLSGGGTAIIAGGPSNNMPFTAPVTMNAVAGGRLIIGGNAVTYESIDQGNTVTQLIAVPVNGLSKVAYGGRLGGVNVPDVLFYGSGATVRYRTTAGGAISSLAFPGGNVQGVAFDPENWKAAWIVGTTAVYSANDIATNGAGGFSNITGNLTGVGSFQTIEYLTLPSGNAIMVGTDLGAYIMRLSTPGVWKTLGDNLPHASVYASHFDKAGQVLAVTVFGRGAWLYDFKSTKATGQYGETFQGFDAGTSSFPSAVGELFSNQLGTAAQLVDSDLRELRLASDGTNGTLTAFRLPDLNPGRATPAFSAKWNAVIYGSQAAALADGFSFNFGPLGAVSGTAFTNGTYANEDGFNAGLTVSVRTWSGNAPGYYVRVNGAVVPGGFVSKPMADWGDFNTTRHFFEVDWRMDTGLTLRVDGATIFTNLATPGFTPGVGDRFVFGARTGAFDETLSLDNLAIFTGGVLIPAAPTAPYYFSADFPSNNQTADKAFDGNNATKWLAQDYTGFIGASLASSATVRLYTLTSAEDVPGRDLAAWDFQTGNDGVLWTQHGSQGAQFFANRGEQRAFVVANPVANAKFRLHISENHEAPELQLSEFQPWVLLNVPAQFTVANANQAGAGSLRQALVDAAPFAGTALITFAPALSGQTITLTSGPIVVNNPDGVTVDASAVNGGITISANNAGRIFNIASTSSCTLKNLILTGGNATGAFPNSYGGAIYAQSAVGLSNCTLAGNHAQVAGGAIYNVGGSLTLNGCTLSGNTAAFGGAIQSEGSLTSISSTFAANTASSDGGAISAPFSNSAVIVHSTISTNSAATGGGVIGNNVLLAYSIVAGNSASSGPDTSGTITTPAANIIGIPPLLAPLDNYGGPTKTMALIPGSPARNAATGSGVTADQRGFPIIGAPDLGAYEAGTFSNYNAFIWETLPASATIAQHDFTFDFDGDGATNGNEFTALTNPSDPASRFRITNIIRSGANVELTFTSVIGRSYSFEYSGDFITWIPLAGSFAGTGNPITTAIGPITGINRLFIRARTGP